MKWGKFFLIIFLLIGGAARAWASNTGSPQEVNVKITQMWVSSNSNCTSMTRIYNNPAATYQNMVSTPTLGSVTVANGTYNCVAWKMSDIITFKPDFNSDSGNCLLGQTYTKDLLITGFSSIAPDGAVINGTTSIVTEDGMWVYVSISGNNNNVARVPSQPAQLPVPYIVTNDNNAFIVTDFTNEIKDISGSCSAEGVSFRSVISRRQR